MAVGRWVLDQMTCARDGQRGGPGEPLWFHSRCHPDAPTWARYEDGVLTIECASCDKLIVEVAVHDDRLRSLEEPPAFESFGAVDGPPDMGGVQ